MNERLTAIFEPDGNDGCIAPSPKSDVASRGIIFAEAPVQLFEAAPAGMFDGQSRIDAPRLIARGPGFRFE